MDTLKDPIERLGAEAGHTLIGGAPEGVLAAAALRCIGGQMQGRLMFRNDEERARAVGQEDGVIFPPKDQRWRPMLAAGRMYGLAYQGDWCDVGHPDAIEIAEDMLAYV